MKTFKNKFFNLCGIKINVINLLLCGLYEFICKYNDYNDIYNICVKDEDIYIIFTDFIIDKLLNLLINTFGTSMNKFDIILMVYKLFEEEDNAILSADEYFNELKYKEKHKKPF